MPKVKLFLSHASEDQADFVRPLAEALSEDFDVWYSEYELLMGDKLLARIDEGLRTCDYGIVVLSPHFFAKRWPREELEGLFQLETAERKVILPIWKEVSAIDVKAFSPILASRISSDAASGIPKIVADIRRTVGLVDRYKEISSCAWKDKLRGLDEDTAHSRKVEDFSRTNAAVEAVSKVAFELIEDAWQTAEKIKGELSTIRLQSPIRARNAQHYFAITGPKRLTLHINFRTVATNSLEGVELVVRVFRDRDDWDEKSKVLMIERYDLRPAFDKEMKVFWTSSTTTFSNGTALIDFAFDKFVTALLNDR